VGNRFEKIDNKPIVMLTTYDAPTAKTAQFEGVDILLVGDSVGTTLLGYDSVNSVTVADICHHTAAVRRGAPDGYILSDLPWEAVQSVKKAVDSAKKIIESGANSVKLEVEAGSDEILKALIENNIEVCAHIGYTPQTVGLAVTAQGRDKTRALELINLANISEKLGAFMIVLELIPATLSQLITETLTIPTIGIGAGPFCTGQVQVVYDITGFSEKVFRHAKIFENSGASFSTAIDKYCKETKAGTFPTLKNCASVSDEFINSLKEEL
jgi:3-methyl-2-oxobutanoate hydroxymethyltransferase